MIEPIDSLSDYNWIVAFIIKLNYNNKTNKVLIKKLLNGIILILSLSMIDLLNR